MSRDESASHVLYRCQYHIVWTPKYRFKLLKENFGKELHRGLCISSSMKKCKVVEQDYYGIYTCREISYLFAKKVVASFGRSQLCRKDQGIWFIQQFLSSPSL